MLNLIDKATEEFTIQWINNESNIKNRGLILLMQLLMLLLMVMMLMMVMVMLLLLLQMVLLSCYCCGAADCYTGANISAPFIAATAAEVCCWNCLL